MSFLWAHRFPSTIQPVVLYVGCPLRPQDGLNAESQFNHDTVCDENKGSAFEGLPDLHLAIGFILWHYLFCFGE